jgi:very-short-patch-repair endonuclease
MKSKFPQYYEASVRTEIYSKVLRRNQTKAELVVWKLLRNRNIHNLKFRRQHPIGPFIADFYCHELRLVIEVDGGIHSDSEVRIADQRRERYLGGLGLKIVRISNEDVFRNPWMLEKKIREVGEVTSPPAPLLGNDLTPDPSPKRRGGGCQFYQ